MFHFIVLYVLTSHFLHNKPRNSAVLLYRHKNPYRAFVNTYINMEKPVWKTSYYVLLTHSWPQPSFVRHDLFLSSPFCIERPLFVIASHASDLAIFRFQIDVLLVLLPYFYFLLMSYYYDEGVFVQIEFCKCEKRVKFIFCLRIWYLWVPVGFVIFIRCVVWVRALW